jgi:hypothetical protein
MSDTVVDGGGVQRPLINGPDLIREGRIRCN